MYDLIFYLGKKAFHTVALLVFSAIFLHAQQRNLDSLQRIVDNASGIAKCDALVELLRAVAGTDNGAAYDLAQEAHSIAVKLGDTARIIDTSRIKGILLNRLSRYKEAEAILERSIPVAKRHHLSHYKTMLNSLAMAYTFQAKYDKALEANFHGLSLREADNEIAEASMSLNNIGLVYFKLRNYHKALEFYQRALEYKKPINDHYDLDRLYINIGLCYNQMENFSKGQEYFKLAFNECGNNCRAPIIVEGEFGLGVAYFGQENDDEALIHFKKSYEIAKESDYKRFQAENLVYVGKIYIRKTDSEAAVKALKECEGIAENEGYVELLIDTYRQFSILYNQIGDYQNAAYYQGKYIPLKDSTYNEGLIENIAKVQTNYAERENLKTIANKNEVIQRQRSLSIAIIIIAVLAALLVFVLFRSNRTKKKVNQALSDAKAIIEDQNRQLLSSNYSLNQELKEKNIELQKANESLLRVNEELDNFIYKTSHDIRGPLASLKGMCNVALMDVRDPLALSYLHKLDITAEKLNTILTRLLIVNQINNSTLASEKIDFAGIVNDVLTLERKKGLPPRLKIKKHIDTDISFHSDRQFVRIILENLIDNAIKFYNDSERVDPFVNIDVTEKDDHVRIKVVDNGIGVSEVHPEKIFQMFSRASERSETGGIGLYITKTATEKLGGSVNLKTTPEGFTEFFVTLPLASTRVVA